MLYIHPKVVVTFTFLVTEKLSCVYESKLITSNWSVVSMAISAIHYNLYVILLILNYLCLFKMPFSLSSVAINV